MRPRFPSVGHRVGESGRRKRCRSNPFSGKGVSVSWAQSRRTGIGCDRRSRRAVSISHGDIRWRRMGNRRCRDHLVQCIRRILQCVIDWRHCNRSVKFLGHLCGNRRILYPGRCSDRRRRIQIQRRRQDLGSQRSTGFQTHFTNPHSPGKSGYRLCGRSGQRVWPE